MDIVVAVSEKNEQPLVDAKIEKKREEISSLFKNGEFGDGSKFAELMKSISKLYPWDYAVTISNASFIPFFFSDGRVVDDDEMVITKNDVIELIDACQHVIDDTDMAEVFLPSMDRDEEYGYDYFSAVSDTLKKFKMLIDTIKWDRSVVKIIFF